MSSSFPRLLIAAPHGRSGKTTFSIGLCDAVRQRGLQVQPFKKGPDYIDPSWLSAAAGRACRTLDPFFQPSEESLKQGFFRGSKDADLVMIEGNHGLYDSPTDDGRGSNAAVARILSAPIILVVNSARMGRSAAAMVHGFQTFEDNTPIMGVVLNNFSGIRHEIKMRTAIETYCGIKVVGAIPRDETVRIPERHLGLIPRGEDPTLNPAIEACRVMVERFIDIEAVLAIARSGVKPSDSSEQPSTQPLPGYKPPLKGPKLGVLRDQAFTFYYPENLEALEDAGARLIFIDALQDTTLPEVDGMYIGGGFPELFMNELEANHSLRQAIHHKIESGLPVYAECGGLMYLSKRIHWGDHSAEMVGAISCEVEIHEQPQGHGYVEAEVTRENPIWPVGTILRGHEFHNSRLSNLNGVSQAVYRLKRGSGLGNSQDGLIYRNVLAAYTHLHVDGSAGWAKGLVGRAQQYAQERRNG